MGTSYLYTVSLLWLPLESVIVRLHGMAYKATFVILISFTSAVSSPVYLLVSQKQDNMLDVQQTNNNTLPLEKQQNIAGKSADSGASSPGFKSQFYYLLPV